MNGQESSSRLTTFTVIVYWGCILLGLGIPRDDIRTSRLSAHPVYDQRNPGVVQGYQASNSVQVKLRNLDQVGSVVDAVTAAGRSDTDAGHRVHVRQLGAGGRGA